MHVHCTHCKRNKRNKFILIYCLNYAVIFTIVNECSWRHINVPLMIHDSSIHLPKGEKYEKET